MGQQVHPIGFRLPLTRDWGSKWYAPRREFADHLHSDLRIREFLKGKLRQAAVSKIVIERAWNSLRVTIFTARPGLVIGRKGSEIENMTKEVSAISGDKQVKIDIQEIRSPETEAQLVAESVAGQLERRIGFRRAMKKSVQIAMEQGALGIKIRCSGRLGGSEIARTEQYREGKVPLHTMRAPIDYGFAEARTTAGAIGIKCWICKGEEAAPKVSVREDKPAAPSAPSPEVVATAVAE